MGNGTMTSERQKTSHAGHRVRMRARFREEGLDTFAPHEVLELLLFEFIPGINTNPIAHTLIARFGSVKNVLTAPYEELLEVSGIGPKAAQGIRSVYALMTSEICTSFRRQERLTENDIAFLADWFMEKAPAGSMGLILCGPDRRFRDFVPLRVSPDDSLLSLGAQIVRASAGGSYYLLVKEDFSLVTREKADVLRRITGPGRALLLDVFILEGYRPTPVGEL